jgi:hypothetical protein
LAWLVSSFSPDNSASLSSLSHRFVLSRSSGAFNSLGLLRDISSKPILSWTPSPSKYTNGKKKLIAIVYVVRWSPFNVTRKHRSTWAHRNCGLPRQCLAPQVGNEWGNRTQAALRSILRLRSCGGTGWNGGTNHLQWRRGCIPYKDGFMHWLHVIGGATLFNSSSMGRFNNDIALRQGHF